MVFLKNQVCWCKGLTKETDIRLKISGKRQSITKKQLIKEKKICQPWMNPMSKGGRKNISFAMQKFNKKNPDFWKGKNNPMYGKENKWGHHTEETKKEIGNMKRGKPNIKLSILAKNRVGKKAGNWKGGLSFQEYPSVFKKMRFYIRKKYNFTCQLCSRKEREGEKFDTHHIDYDKKNCRENNLILLCRKCHFKTNGRRNYWKIYFPKVMNPAL